MRNPESEYGSESSSRWDSALDRARRVKDDVAARAIEGLAGSVESGRAQWVAERAIDVTEKAAKGAMLAVPGVGLFGRVLGRRALEHGAEAARGRVPDALRMLSDRLSSGQFNDEAADDYDSGGPPVRPNY